MAQNLINLPVVIVAEKVPGDWEFVDPQKQIVDQYTFEEDLERDTGHWGEWIAAGRPAPEQRPLGDPWDILQRFLCVRTPHELLRFLRQTGHFADEILWIDDEGNEEYGETEISVQAFWTLQKILWSMLRNRDPHPDMTSNRIPDAWKAKFEKPLDLAIQQQRGGTRARIRCVGVLEAILSIIRAKIAQGARFGFCARKDCRLPFEKTSRHKRKFCKQYCAHLQSLRKRRGTCVGLTSGG